MHILSQIILSVIAASFVLALLGGILDQKGTSAALFRLFGGIFLALTIIQPIADLDFSGLNNYIESFSAEGEAAAAEGENIADEKYQAIIKSRVEAYILDKADSLGTDIEVEITLNDDAVPVEARLQGDVSPYAKSQIQTMLDSELGIAKEDQRWIG